MSVYLTLLPAGHDSHALLPNTDAATRVATFTARPSDRNSWAVGQDLLAALGVNLGLAGSGSGHEDDMKAASAWITAHDVALIRVRHADNLAGSAALDELVALCSQLSVTLLLACDDEIRDNPLLHWIHDNAHHLLRPEPALRLADTHRRPVRTSDDERDTGDPNFPQTLPICDFPLFRVRCRDLLDPEGQARVDRLYRDTFRHVQSQPPADSGTAAELLRELISTRPSPGEALVIVRAAQAALFTLGLQLKVHLPRLMLAVDDAKFRRLTPAELRALRRYREPERATTLVLYDANLSLDEISQLTLGHVTPDGNLTGVNADPLHPAATVYLRAQAAYRRLDGATSADPLVTNSKAKAGRLFRAVTTDLCLPHGRDRIATKERRSHSWRYDTGATLMSLDTTPNLRRKETA